MECRICRIQYIGKSGKEFNIRLNNHCKDVNRQKCLITTSISMLDLP